jgi:hypothetical protein
MTPRGSRLVWTLVAGLLLALVVSAVLVSLYRLAVQ